MNIGLQIRGEFLDLRPGTVIELEEENLFLQMSNVIQGPYTLPLVIPMTEKNIRLLGHPNILNIKKNNKGVEAILFTNDIQHSRGRIKIESVQSNLNFPQRGVISIYYLFGSSDFFKSVENVYLSGIDFGPDYSFPYGNFDPVTTGSFFEHVTEVMNNGSPDKYNYAFFPVVNKAGIARAPSYDTILNSVQTVHPDPPALRCALFTYNVSKSFDRWVNEICPFSYLTFVLKKAFEHVGWKLQGDILEDADFKKIVLIYNHPIDWLSAYIKHTNVTWNLRDHVPEIKMSSFLIALQNRIGWWYDYDYRKKICTIRFRKEVFAQRKRKDFSKKADPNYISKLTEADKIYSLTQGTGNTKPNFGQLNYKGILQNTYQLPAAGQQNVNDLYFISGENSYWFSTRDVNEQYLWEKSADNTFDYTPALATDEITTRCMVPDSMITPLFNIMYGQAYVFNFVITNRDACMPVVNLSPDEGETDTFYIAFHHGVVQSINKQGLPELNYPFGSAAPFDLHGNKLRSYSLTFEYPVADGDMGLYRLNWEKFLSYLVEREVVTIPIALSVTDVIGISYTDSIIINNTEYFIKNPHITLPVKEFTNMELIRI